MGLLNRQIFLVGGVVAITVAVAAGFAAPLIGLDAASIMVGLIVGLVLATVTLVLRALEPLERAVNQLNNGDLASDSPLGKQCADLLADAGAGRTLLETLSGNIEKSAAASAGLSSSAEQLKDGFDYQASEAARIAEQTALITSNAREAAAQALDASARAMQNRELSVEGREALLSAISSVRAVHEQSAENLKLIQDLDEKSSRIQGVTTTIQGIAEQTNLLALNAAIEAARAGDQGRGFAVVADEVRQLAGRTAQATGEVAETLQEIKSDTSAIVARIEALARSVETGLQSVESVGERLDRIRDQSDHVQQQVARIAEIDQDNERNLQQVSSAIETVRGRMAESGSVVDGLANQSMVLAELTEEVSSALARSGGDGR